MDHDRLHFFWNAEQNERELTRIIDAIEKHFPGVRFRVRMTLARRYSGQDQTEIHFYREGEKEDQKICTVHHILGSYLSIHNIVAAVRTAFQ